MADRHLSIRLLSVAVFASAGVLSKGSLASDIPGYPEHPEAFDSREVAMLPRYCIYTQLFRDRVPGGNNPAEIERWTNVMGPIFNAVHHYCLGLMRTNRAVLLARTQQSRKFYLESALNEFTYVTDRAPADFVLLPEIHTKKGENFIRLDKAGPGIKELERAIELKADYWPAYAALSDYYKKTGDVTKARQLLDHALKYSPDSVALKRRLGELEGAKPKPKGK